MNFAAIWGRRQHAHHATAATPTPEDLRFARESCDKTVARLKREQQAQSAADDAPTVARQPEWKPVGGEQDRSQSRTSYHRALSLR